MAGPPANTSDLDALIGAFIAREMAEHPVAASGLGWPDRHDDELGDQSAAAHERRDREDRAWLEAFNQIADGDLSLDQRLDRDLAISALRGRVVLQDWAAWRREPAGYLGAGLSGVFSLFLHRLLPDAELARCAAARLRQVPEVLDHARANLDAGLANELIVRRGLGQCRAGITYARDLVPAEVGEDHRPALAEAGEVAAEAFTRFAEFLEGLAVEASGPYAIGEERYSALLQQKELLGYGAAEMRQRGQAAYDELDAEMRDLAGRIDPDGGGDWRTLVQQLNQDHPPTPEAMREEYERWTEAARRFLHDTGLVTVPEGEVCRVVPSPPFQRPVLAVASYMAPPAFQPSLTGHFFVPFPPDGVTEREVQQRLETNSHHSIPAISVHEAYPGHHWHLVTMNRNPRPLRRVLRTPYFSEGWALYAEKVLREHGFFTDPRHELCQLDARIFRAARIVVDTSLHLGDMSVEEAVTHMSTKASLSEPTARAEVGRYCAWPTQASSYLTGALEIERIRDRWMAEDRGSLREFHDTIAGSGSLPIALAEQATLA